MGAKGKKVPEEDFPKIGLCDDNHHFQRRKDPLTSLDKPKKYKYISNITLDEAAKIAREKAKKRVLNNLDKERLKRADLMLSEDREKMKKSQKGKLGKQLSYSTSGLTLGLDKSGKLNKISKRVLNNKMMDDLI